MGPMKRSGEEREAFVEFVEDLDRADIDLAKVILPNQPGFFRLVLPLSLSRSTLVYSLLHGCIRISYHKYCKIPPIMPSSYLISTTYDPLVSLSRVYHTSLTVVAISECTKYKTEFKACIFCGEFHSSSARTIIDHERRVNPKQTR